MIALIFFTGCFSGFECYDCLFCFCLLFVLCSYGTFWVVCLLRLQVWVVCCPFDFVLRVLYYGCWYCALTWVVDWLFRGGLFFKYVDYD